MHRGFSCVERAKKAAINTGNGRSVSAPPLRRLFAFSDRLLSEPREGDSDHGEAL
jgi:hypothetical protein